MKLFLTLIVLVITTISAFAGSGDWHSVSTRSEFASNAQEFLLLQQKYPRIFGSYDPAQIAQATISIDEYLYEGITACSAGDPRLLHDVISSSVCEKNTNENSSGSCTETADSLPISGDPCNN